MNKLIIASVALIFMCFLSGVRAEEIIALKGLGGYVIYKGKVGDEWRAVEIRLLDGDIIHPFSVSPNASIYFDGGRESNLSKNGLYVVVNKIERGVVYMGDSSEEVEKYYCSFVEIKSGCVLKEEVGEFCGGYWSNKNDKWNIAGRSVEIDERLTERKGKNLVEYFSGFSGAENLNRCVPN